MIGANSIIAWVEPGTNVQSITCRELHSKDPEGCVVVYDPCYATPNDILASNIDGITTVSFKRPFRFHNKINNIVPISSFGFQTVIWAVGRDSPMRPNNSTLSKEIFRGLFAADFNTGQTMANLPPNPTFPTSPSIANTNIVMGFLVLFCLILGFQIL